MQSIYVDLKKNEHIHIKGTNIVNIFVLFIYACIQREQLLYFVCIQRKNRNGINIALFLYIHTKKRKACCILLSYIVNKYCIKICSFYIYIRLKGILLLLYTRTK